MVEVRYNGRLGNQLFMYASGRIIAEEMGYELSADSIDGFEGTNEKVGGRKYEKPVQILRPRDNPNVAEIIADKTPRKIILKSYMQHYENIRDRSEEVRKWFRLPEGKKADSNSVVVQVRLGDFVKLGWAPSIDYYTRIIDENFTDKKIIVMTDEPCSPHLSELSRYDPEFYSGSPQDQFRFATTASNLIIGTSTFSWWAAFLSNAKVVAPIMKRGYYSFKPFRNENYIVKEDRYTYVKDVNTMSAEEM